MTSPIPVICDEGGLLAVNKPPGLPVVPGAGHAAGRLPARRLERQLGARLWVVHRLDRDTSGVLVFARTADAHRALCLAFEQRLGSKDLPRLHAGRAGPAGGPHRRRRCTPPGAARHGRPRPGEDGAGEAATRYIVRKRWEQDGAAVALVEAHPETGRHHQIRVHLRSIGTPDPLRRLVRPGSARRRGLARRWPVRGWRCTPSGSSSRTPRGRGPHRWHSTRRCRRISPALLHWLDEGLRRAVGRPATSSPAPSSACSSRA